MDFCTERKNITGVLTDIQRFSVQDGIGIRTIVFLKGCPLRCRWCHNPETNLAVPEMMFTPENCIGCGSCLAVCKHGAITPEDMLRRDRCTACGDCVAVCCTKARTRIGEEKTVAEVMREVEKDAVFFQTSGGGLTLSGGEPTAQPEFAQALLAAAKESGVGTAIETCGYCAWDRFLPIVEQCDMLLYDIKHMDPETHRRYTGVDNACILDNLRRIGRMHKRIIIRIPLIPGVNDAAENLRSTAHMAKEVGAEEIHVLPFHQLSEGKWDALGRDYSFRDYREPSPEELASAKQTLEEAAGLSVNVGGHGEYRSEEART